MVLMRRHQYHSGMEVRQLQYFLALAQELSFTKAAARARVAQPALSRQIRKLEDELGTALVDRTSRQVQITDAGQRLAVRARTILDEIESARAEIQETTDLSTGRLMIGTTQTPGPLNVVRLLSDFHTLYPGIELAVREELSVSIADRLRSDELDLGIIAGIPEAARRGLQLQEIASEPLVVALHPQHPFAEQDEVDFRTLEDEPFILFPEGATIRSTFDRLASRHGIKANVAFVTTDTDRMRELVSLGLGVSLLPQSDANRPSHIHASARVSGESLAYTVYLATRANRRRSPAAAAMARLLSSNIRP
jgi:LysR family transcriptional activator of glutamate synthase operon